MKNLNAFLVYLVAMFALFASLSGVSAFADITSVEVNGGEALSTGRVFSALAGETIPVRVAYEATSDAEDVRLKAWISGESGLSVSTPRFDVIAGDFESKVISVQMPFDIDPDQTFELIVALENEEGTADQEIVDLRVKRESYLVQVLDVIAQPKVVAGENLMLDIVLKNRGRHFSEDTFVKVTIPALGVEDRAYFGDLSPEDQFDPDKEDAVERRMFVEIPTNAPAGVYVVEIEAFSDDSSTTVSRQLAIVGASEDTIVVSGTHAKTLAVGETGSYSVTLVNSGNRVRVYELVFETSSGLTLEAEEPVVAVPAGTSKSVNVNVKADKAGTYNFAVNVHSDSELVKRESFTAKVEGKSVAGNATVLLTVILAIIFVILLVVLIVLLSRKPEKSEEFGESYY